MGQYLSAYGEEARQTESAMPIDRFTIRDLLWLTVVVALSCGWAVSAEIAKRRYDVIDHDLSKAEIEKAVMRHYWASPDALREAGIEWPPSRSSGNAAAIQKTSSDEN